MTSSFWIRFVGNPRVLVGLIWLALVMIGALAAPLIAPLDPFAMTGKPFVRPLDGFLFGTDSLGRSVWSGLVHGARTTLLIAVIATLAAVACGGLLGALSGFYGGRIDNLLMRLN